MWWQGLWSDERGRIGIVNVEGCLIHCKPKSTAIYREPIFRDYPISNKLKDSFKVKIYEQQKINKSRLTDKITAIVREINREESFRQ